MDNYLEATTNSIKGKSIKQIFSLPGGKFAAVTAVLAGGGIIYGLFKALPFLIAGAANLTIFIAELVGLALLLMVVTSPRTWKIIATFWYIITKKILSLVVKMDPISILEQGVRRLKNQYDELCENVTKLGGVLEQMKKDIKQYQDEFEKNVRLRSAAQKKMERFVQSGDTSSEEMLQTKSNFVVINNEIARLEKIIKAQQKRIALSEKYLSVMKKLKIMSNMKVRDIENEMHWRKQEYEQAKKTETAMKSIKAIFSDGFSKTLEEQMAIDYVNEVVNNATADMQSLLDGSNFLLSDFDLTSEANFEKVDEILDRFEKDGFASFDENFKPATTVDQPYQAATPELPQQASGTISTSELMGQQKETEKIVRKNYF